MMPRMIVRGGRIQTLDFVPRGELFRYANASDEPASLLLVHTPSFRLEAEIFEPEP